MDNFFSSIDDLLGSTDLLHENPVTIAQELSTNTTGTSSGRFQSMLEISGQAHGKTYFVNGNICSLGCNVIIGMLPTNEQVNGFGEKEIPPWNVLCVEEVECLLQLARQILDDVGILIFVTSKFMTHQLGKVCEPCGFKVHHLVTVACKTAVGMTRGMTVRFSAIR